jgi:hypothetical protein
MEIGRAARREILVNKARTELGSLVARGVSMAGNAFSSVLFLKGEPNAEEQAGTAPLSGADGKALRAALGALGYAPEDWCAALTVDEHGLPLDRALVREVVCTIDPATLIACDDAAAQAVREAYADTLVTLDDFEAAMLLPGHETQLLGMRVMALGGFEAALVDAHQKQVMWARLKRLPPLGAPY